MIVINARISVTAGQVGRMKQAIAEMERASRAEPGCFDYAFATDVSDPGVMRIVERWESAEALRAHFATPHMAGFQAAMQQDPPAGMEVKVYEVKEIPLPRR
jgi:quinol monooxygenase YgiN